MHIIFGGIRPDIKLHNSHTSLQSLNYRNVAAIAAQLISGQIRIMSGVYEIVGQRSCHILMNLIWYTSQTHKLKSFKLIIQVTNNCFQNRVLAENRNIPDRK